MKNKLKMLLVLGVLVPFNTFALEKEETVYTNLDNTGKVTNTVVVNHLVNKDSGILDDESNLTDILNINGNEKFELINNNIKWTTSGSDIFYRGKIDKPLPIDTKITYYLDNKKMDVKDMIGKSGSVKIKLNFTNNLKNTVLINGAYKTLYTPFLVTVGVSLDNNNTNISVTNGKVVNVGTKTAIVAIASPGLYDSLGIDELKDLQSITFTYDTTKFKIDNMYILSTPKLLDNNDLEIFDKLDSIYNSVNKLQLNINKIEEGSVTLQDASSLLKEKLGNTIEVLNNNSGDALTSEQINTIKNKTLSNISTIYTDEYKNSIADSTWNTVKNNLNPNDSNVINIVTNSVESTVKAYLSEGNNYNTYLSCSNGTLNPNDEACIKIINDIDLIKKYSALSSSNTASGVSNYVAESVSKEVSVAISQNTAEQVASNVAENVSKEVSNQVKNTLMETIKKSINALYSGVDKIAGGIDELNNGISLFNKNGISLLSNYSYTIKNYSDISSSLINLSNDYSGYSSSLSTKTLFISMVKSVK